MSNAEIKREEALDKIVGSYETGGGNYFTDGDYRCQVLNLELKSGSESMSFIGEFLILDAKPQRDDVAPNRVGSTANSVSNLTKHKSAAGNVKAMMGALLQCLGYDVKALDNEQYKALLRSATSPEQPLRGLIVTNNTYRKTIKTGTNQGKEITLNGFKAIAHTKEQLKAQRAALDAMPTPTAQPAAAKPANEGAAMLDALAGLGVG